MATFLEYHFPEDDCKAIDDARRRLGELKEKYQGQLDNFNIPFNGKTKSFYVGDDQTLETILSQLKETIENELTGLNAYLDEVDGFMTTVTDYMCNDQEACSSAWKVYNDIAARKTDLMTDEERADNTQEAEQAGERVWIDNRCDLWK